MRKDSTLEMSEDSKKRVIYALMFENIAIFCYWKFHFFEKAEEMEGPRVEEPSPKKMKFSEAEEEDEDQENRLPSSSPPSSPVDEIELK